MEYAIVYNKDTALPKKSNMKKLYSLDVNGHEAVSVEMDVPDFMPRTTLNREWLRGVITEEVVKPAPRKTRARHRPRATRPGKSLKVSV